MVYSLCEFGIRKSLEKFQLPWFLYVYRQGFRLIVKEATGCKSRAQVHDEIIREFGISDKKRPILGLFLLLVSKSTAKGGIYKRAF